LSDRVATVLQPDVVQMASLSDQQTEVLGGAAHEVVRGETGEFAIESNREQQVDAALPNLFDLSFWSADSFRRLIRVKHLYGVRLKRHGNGRQCETVCIPNHGLENCLMTQVKPVKVSDAENAGAACQSVRCCRQ